MAVSRIPPNNIEAEQAVLGALLIDHEAINTVSQMVKPEYFYEDNNKKIYKCMLSLYEERKPIDLLTLTHILKKKKSYDQIGGSEYLTSLANSVPTAANIEHYANILRETYLRRSLITVAGTMTDLSFSDNEAEEVLNRVEQEIFSLSQESVRQGFIHVREALAESFDKLDELHKREALYRGIATGFVDLDLLLSGLQDSNLIVLAARPGQGKTAFVVNVAQYVASILKIPVGMFSLEMSKEELVDRLLISQANIDAWKLKTGKLSDEDFEKLSQAMGELAEAPIYIDDTPGATISEMRSKARRLQIEHEMKLLIVDYMQLVNPGRRFENRVQEVSFISQSLKNLARELKIPILAVSQLSRAVEHRGIRKPQLADLRESGAIEQDADVVVFLYTEDEEFTPQRIVKVVVAKHRNGPVGERELLFRGDRIKFFNIERTQDEAPATN
ncbi:MAG: replicative DNA helicase [Candidatus Levybacteria bacterium RIFCSPHIGHO2_02_FULL_40_18]|nr:MAG: replicative DNA helicase [Candidatus Levybacteria bacterium RIFCSPHIGHO2_01_FULL_40_58]OGH26761.1 MAG: replicative DNA helicase [Candidatus Levybacteria bacterium RIFCSPHIGHO2_02_FULL_40_18]OGH31696.1 MAG: replicative DNA helicase [Candidatus Levybacteria bacterium RIFCSPHIGHO2_12_FULL_40_31]OGH40596.1 MAG: replicative DNA helicase [Candidatus Levybacteria bacterium RIFCSPLOWO2_01_FULL_40_64]OGH48769.1 MAG: replicative DNA helicase [Candidatus Levybacteria bacterium RIFCSPLOWO2_02_FULL_